MGKARIRVQESYRLDEIYRYTRDRWGKERAHRFIAGLFKAFDGIPTHQTRSKPIPAEFGIEGFFFRYESHIVYWRRLSKGGVGIVTILHERIHPIDRFREEFSL